MTQRALRERPTALVTAEWRPGVMGVAAMTRLYGTD